MTTPNDSRRTRIFLVDDTQANLDVLQALLEPEGYLVSVAPNGEFALKFVGRVKPDLILLDVMMPDINGFEVCRRLKADPETRHIPIIFITAEDTTESVVSGFEAGGVDYIQKPFQGSEVLARVQTHLEIDRLKRELVEKNDALTRMNRQVREASDRKSRFLANIAHELRSPINAIMGFTRMVLRREGDRLSERQQRNLTTVTKSSDHMLHLINDLLDLSKIEAGRMDVNAERFELNDFIEACCEEVTPLVKAGVELVWPTGSVGDVETDRGRLRQILMNLLSNAAKFTESGSIRVGASRDADVVTIGVTDSGTGIPQDAQETIFEEFEQVGGSDPERKGTGLGLPIAKGFAELLGGSIDLTSVVGEGSTFTIRLPVLLSDTSDAGSVLSSRTGE